MILSNYPVSVISGCSYSSIASEAMGDYQAVNILPTDTWGTQFIVLPVVLLKGYDLVRVLGKY